MNIKDSTLYQFLANSKRFRPPHYDILTIYNVMYGYQLGINSSFKLLEEEAWVAQFFAFIDDFLLSKYYSNEYTTLPQNFGEVIFQNQENEDKGIYLFLHYS